MVTLTTTKSKLGTTLVQVLQPESSWVKRGSSLIPRAIHTLDVLVYHGHSCWFCGIVNFHVMDLSVHWRQQRLTPWVVLFSAAEASLVKPSFFDGRAWTPVLSWIPSSQLLMSTTSPQSTPACFIACWVWA